MSPNVAPMSWDTGPGIHNKFCGSYSQTAAIFIMNTPGMIINSAPWPSYYNRYSYKILRLFSLTYYDNDQK